MLTASAIAIFMSSKPWTACSVIVRFNTALNNLPCRSTLPICLVLSILAWRIRTPCWASVRAKTPWLWTPRSQLKVCGQQAQRTQKLTKLSKQSRLDGELCPCRSSATCLKVIPKSRMFKHYVLDFQNIDAEIPTENVVFWKRYLGRLMFGFVIFTGIASKMTACLKKTREEPEQHAKFEPEQLKMGVQTVDASAVCGTHSRR